MIKINDWYLMLLVNLKKNEDHNRSNSFPPRRSSQIVPISSSNLIKLTNWKYFYKYFSFYLKLWHTETPQVGPRKYLYHTIGFLVKLFFLQVSVVFVFCNILKYRNLIFSVKFLIWRTQKIELKVKSSISKVFST